MRRRVPDLSAVQLCHEFLEAHLTPGGLFLDATCGNGNDTLFLCRLAGQNGRVLGMDIQPQAVDRTNRRLKEAGYDKIGRAVFYDHARLGELVQPARWTACCSISAGCPAPSMIYIRLLMAVCPPCVPALDALRPGGVLAAVLYSGKVIGDAEKQAALAFFRTLPLTKYTVLVCEFANWADTAPLPCFVIKK